MFDRPDNTTHEGLGESHMLRRSQGAAHPLGGELQAVSVGWYKVSRSDRKSISGLMARVGPHVMRRATVGRVLVGSTCDG